MLGSESQRPAGVRRDHVGARGQGGAPVARGLSNKTLYLKILQPRQPPQLLQQGEREDRVRREPAVGGPPAREERGGACVEIKLRAPHAIDATCFRSCVCSTAWRFNAIDAMLSP